MRAVGARAGVQSAQLNGKQKEVTHGSHTPRVTPNLRCPRNGTADEVFRSKASAHALTPLKAAADGKVRKRGSASPDTGQQGDAPRCVMRCAPAGKLARTTSLCEFLQ